VRSRHRARPADVAGGIVGRIVLSNRLPRPGRLADGNSVSARTARSRALGPPAQATAAAARPRRSARPAAEDPATGSGHPPACTTPVPDAPAPTRSHSFPSSSQQARLHRRRPAPRAVARADTVPPPCVRGARGSSR
jgi:hypothetical protein